MGVWLVELLACGVRSAECGFAPAPPQDVSRESDPRTTPGDYQRRDFMASPPRMVLSGEATRDRNNDNAVGRPNTYFATGASAKSGRSTDGSGHSAPFLLSHQTRCRYRGCPIRCSNRPDHLPQRAVHGGWIEQKNHPAYESRSPPRRLVGLVVPLARGPSQTAALRFLAGRILLRRWRMRWVARP